MHLLRQVLEVALQPTVLSRGTLKQGCEAAVIVSAAFAPWSFFQRDAAPTHEGKPFPLAVLRVISATALRVISAAALRVISATLVSWCA